MSNMNGSLFFGIEGGLYEFTAEDVKELDYRIGIKTAIEGCKLWNHLEAGEKWYHRAYMNELASRQGKSVASKMGEFKGIPLYGRSIRWSVLDDPLNYDCWEVRHKKDLIKDIVKEMFNDWKRQI